MYCKFAVRESSNMHCFIDSVIEMIITFGLCLVPRVIPVSLTYFRNGTYSPVTKSKRGVSRVILLEAPIVCIEQNIS